MEVLVIHESNYDMHEVQDVITPDQLESYIKMRGERILKRYKKINNVEPAIDRVQIRHWQNASGLMNSMVAYFISLGDGREDVRDFEIDRKIINKIENE